MEFQSPSGDSLFSDPLAEKNFSIEQVDCFNPLAGIRCFLTELVSQVTKSQRDSFQSPSGDSLFSDICLTWRNRSVEDSSHRFNPLAGIRCFLTISKWAGASQARGSVSIP